MLRTICKVIFRLKGWKLEGSIPEDLRSFILLGAPHTSNFDIVPAMSVADSVKRNTRFVIKDDWLKFPLNLIMGPAGAIGINRDKLKEGAASTTDAMALLFKEHKDLVLMIAPEGTRSATHQWKTGFYYIAQKAGIPIVLAFADYQRKVAGVGPVIVPVDFEKDMAQIMDFYKNKVPARPDQFLLDSRFMKRP